jgi:cytochrome P450
MHPASARAMLGAMSNASASSARYAAAREAPSLPALPIVGSLPLLSWQGPIAAYTRAWHRYGDAFRVQLGPRRAIVVIHPDAVAQVLVSERENYVKGDTYEQLRLLTGDGLVTLEGERWRKRRRLAQPAFHKDSVRALVDSFVLVVREGLRDLRQRLPQGGVIEAHHEMTQLTLDVVGETLLGRRLGASAGSSAHAFAEAFEVLARRGELPVALPLWLPTPGNRRLKRALGTLDAIVYGIISAARSVPDGGRPTLLSMLMAARDEESGEPLSDLELRDEVLTLVMAGHETTALLMTWGFTLLGREPEVVARVRAELDQVLNGREPTADDLPKLVYLKQVIHEILRLRPPAWILGRDVAADGELAGFRVRAGELVTPLPYLTHRHPEFWPEPERFNPENFSAERVKERPNWAYYPFSAGPRSCIGNLFTLTEAQVIFALLLQQADFSLAHDTPVPLKPMMTLRPDGPVDVRLRWR